jgi:hypothetical protein
MNNPESWGDDRMLLESILNRHLWKALLSDGLSSATKHNLKYLQLQVSYLNEPFPLTTEGVTDIGGTCQVWLMGPAALQTQVSFESCSRTELRSWDSLVVEVWDLTPYLPESHILKLLQSSGFYWPPQKLQCCLMPNGVLSKPQENMCFLAVEFIQQSCQQHWLWGESIKVNLTFSLSSILNSNKTKSLVLWV